MDSQSNNPGIIRPPTIFYEDAQIANNHANQSIRAQKNKVYITTQIDATEKGILRYMKGHNDVLMKYPVKGWPTPEATWNCNIVKRKLMGMLYTFSSKWGWPMWFAFLLNPWKLKWVENAIHHFTWEADWIMRTSFFKEEIWCPTAKELKKILYLFLHFLGFNEWDAINFSKAIAFLIETDDAYRYRIQDIFTETTLEKLLANPRQEIDRLFEIYSQRELGGIEYKFKLISKGINLALLHPKIKKIFKNIIKEININNLQLDKADYYHCLYRDRYNFAGKTFEERWKEFEDAHDGHPPYPLEVGLT